MEVCSLIIVASTTPSTMLRLLVRCSGSTVCFGGIHVQTYSDIYSDACFSMLTSSGGCLSHDVVASLEGTLHTFIAFSLLTFGIPRPATTRMSISLRLNRSHSHAQTNSLDHGVASQPSKTKDNAQQTCSGDVQPSHFGTETARPLSVQPNLT